VTHQISAMDVVSALRQLRGGGVVRLATREVQRMAKKGNTSSKQSQDPKKMGPSPPLTFSSASSRGPRLRLRQVHRLLSCTSGQHRPMTSTAAEDLLLRHIVLLSVRRQGVPRHAAQNQLLQFALAEEGAPSPLPRMAWARCSAIRITALMRIANQVGALPRPETFGR
jgi:hypothetical protein